MESICRKMETIEELQSENKDLEHAILLMGSHYKRELDNKHNYIKMLENRHAEEIRSKNEIIKSKNREIEKLEYALKGACQEHLNLNVSISPVLMDQVSKGDMDLAHEISKNANRRLSHDVEKRLGDRYDIIKELERAMRHIYYLENHAAANCVGFTPFGMKQKFY